MPRTKQDPMVRFMERVNKREDGCWEWTGSRNDKGYGWFWDGVKNVRAHKWFWEQKYGPVPEGLDLAHKCFRSWCVRRSHLRPSTRRDNILDKFINYTKCPKGHELTGARMGQSGNIVRYCKACQNIRDRKRRAK